MACKLRWTLSVPSTKHGQKIRDIPQSMAVKLLKRWGRDEQWIRSTVKTACEYGQASSGYRTATGRIRVTAVRASWRPGFGKR